MYETVVMQSIWFLCFY